MLKDGSNDLTKLAGQNSIEISDREILHDLSRRVVNNIEKEELLSQIYSRYIDVKKTSDEWIKFYMIAVALLLIYAGNGTNKFSIFGAELGANWVGPASVVYFSYCTAVYTNYELKMRWYRSIFNTRFERDSVDGKALILTRYPLAFYGGSYVPLNFKPKDNAIDWKQFVGLTPMIAVAALGWLVAIPGLMFLLGYNLDKILDDPNIIYPVKIGTCLAFISALVFSGAALRNPKKKRKYQPSN